MLRLTLEVGEARVVDLTATTCGLAQSTVSEHLACLREYGLVASRLEGRASVYYLAQPALAELFQTAEALLPATVGANRSLPAISDGIVISILGGVIHDYELAA